MTAQEMIDKLEQFDPHTDIDLRFAGQGRWDEFVVHAFQVGTSADIEVEIVQYDPNAEAL